MADALSSMTGFGRSAGAHRGRAWSWELRSVNHRGFDLRLRLPPGLDQEEPALRALAQARIRRGSVQASLSLGADGLAGPALDTALLDRLLTLATNLAARIPGAPAPRAEALLALPGVLRIAGPADADPTLGPAVLAGFAMALEAVVASRDEEGERLRGILSAQIDTAAALRDQAAEAAEAQIGAQRIRLRESVRLLLADGAAISEDRLMQELAVLATRADVREELDRLGSHIAAARALLREGAEVGRRLDFLVQEFNREANTLCAKSASVALTATGLRLKAVIEQVREQVQNVA